MTTPNTITLPISSLKSYLTKALVFISKTRMTSNPLFCCLYFKDDKCYVNNGETGAVINFPMTVSQPTLFFPFHLSQVVNTEKDESEITFSFDYQAMWCKVTSQNIDIKIKLLDPTEFHIPEAPDDLELFEIEGFYEKVKRASFATHIDISLPLLQGIRVTAKSFCSTDQRSVWREESESPHEFVIPDLLKDHIEKLGIEPAKIGLNANQIHLIYQDMLMFGARLAEDDKYPKVDSVFEQKIRTLGDLAVVEYDRESLTQKLETLMMLSTDDAIKLSCSNKVLLAQNIVKDSGATEAKISLAVNSNADFDNVVVNGKLFQNGVQRFIQFRLKEDQKRIYFHRDTTQEYCISRRDVR